MFAKFDGATKPTAEGIQSLVEAKLLHPDQAAALQGRLAIQAKLDGGVYRVGGYRDGMDHDWALVEARWDGAALDGDLSADLAKAVAPLTVRAPSFDAERGMFVWAVQVPSPDDEDGGSSRRRGRSGPSAEGKPDAGT